MHVQDAELVSTLSGHEGGPPLEAAAYCRLDTAVGAARWLGPLGNYLVARPAARHAAREATERTDLPLDAAVVLGVGGGELHVWKADPMLSTVGDHLGSVPLARLTGARFTPARSWSALTLSFADGEELELQARGDGSGLARAVAEGAGT